MKNSDSFQCYCCKIEKHLSEFHKSKARKNGYSGKCKKCMAEYHKRNKEAFNARCRDYHLANKERRIKQMREWRENNQDTYRESKRQHYKKNRQHILELKKERRGKEEIKIKESEYMVEWRDRNKDRIRDYDRFRYHQKRKHNLVYRLSKAMAGAIRKSLKEGKNGKHWEDLTGYSADKLKRRLQDTMPIGYSWDDYLNGCLHIDHIIPIAVHNFSSFKDMDFRKCWDLNNLRLLPARENIIKRDKLETPFQPSFAGL